MTKTEKKTPTDIADADLDRTSGGFTATDDLYKWRKAEGAPAEAGDGHVTSIDALRVINRIN